MTRRSDHPNTDLLIHGGRVIDPATGFDQTADVLISGGLVAEIGRVSPGDDVQRIDADGCIVTAGLIDIHVHLREPDPQQEETIQTGAAAALNGGFTTVCCMPNTRPPLDTIRTIDLVKSKARAAAAARIFPVACTTLGRKGETLADIESLAKAGAVAFSDDGDCLVDEALMDKALRRIRATGACFMQHCQDPQLTQGAAMNAGALADRLGLAGWPAAAEETIIERDIRLNRSIGCRYHAQHLSSGGSVALVRDARTQGEPVTAEVTPHHLLLTEDLCEGYNTRAKVNPPLRGPQDIALLKEGVADGTITILATDHAPHPAQRKAVSFADAAFGMVGLDCALPLYARALIEDGVLDWPAMLSLMTIRPAQLIGLDRIGLGTLAVGQPADVTLIDPDLEWTIEPDQFASAGRNCPFDGWQVRGRAIATIVGGTVKLCRATDRAPW